MQYVKETLLANIEYITDVNNIKMNELEKICEVSSGYFSRFKASDDQSAPNLNILLKLCNYFNISLDFLLFEQMVFLSKEEIVISNFLEKAFFKTANNEISWKHLSYFFTNESLISNGIQCIINSFDEKNNNAIYGFTSLFDVCKSAECNSKFYLLNLEKVKYLLVNYSNMNNDYYENYNERESYDHDIELYLIKDNCIQKIIASEKLYNDSIKMELENLYECILKMDRKPKIDNIVLETLKSF